MKVIKGFFMAWGNFCAIPCPWRPWDNEARTLMLAQLPVIGLAMGGIWYGLSQLLLWLELPVIISTVMLCIYPFIVSGFIHLDGFMDCCDAIFSRAPLEKKKEILKDSRVGAFAVIWTVILFMVCAASVYAGIDGEKNMMIFVFLPAVSRACGSFAVIAGSKSDRSQYMDLKDENRGCLLFIGITAAAVLAGSLLISGTAMLLILLCAPAAGCIIMWKAQAALGGMNGDVAGYGITWIELYALLFWAVI